MVTPDKGEKNKSGMSKSTRKVGTGADVNSETEKKDASLRADILQIFFCRKMSIFLGCFLTSQGKREANSIDANGHGVGGDIDDLGTVWPVWGSRLVERQSKPMQGTAGATYVLAALKKCGFEPNVGESRTVQGFLRFHGQGCREED